LPVRRYRGDGAFGQYCVVFPDHNATLIITSASPDMQEALNLVWQYILPALEGSDTPVATRTEKLEIVAPTGPAPKAGNGRTYRFESNDASLAAVRLDPDGTGTFTFQSDGATQGVVCGPAPGGNSATSYAIPPAARTARTSSSMPSSTSDSAPAPSPPRRPPEGVTLGPAASS
jgi:hypothetical protein